MPGPAPKPTHLKLLDGNPGKRALNKREPKPTGEPIAPSFFTDAQRAVWDEAIASAPAGLLKRLDSSVLAGWCVAFDLWRRAVEQVNKTGLVTQSPTQGVPMQNPYLAVVNKQQGIMLKCAAEMGFTPASRTRIALDPGDGKEKNEFSRFTSR
jgi:P27 family predicted phage terminase small subunit